MLVLLTKTEPEVISLLGEPTKRDTFPMGNGYHDMVWSFDVDGKESTLSVELRDGKCYAMGVSWAPPY